MLKAVNVLTSYIKLCIFVLNSNEPIKVAHLQKLANQSMLNGARKQEWKQEKLCSFDKARNVLVKKIKDMGNEKYISTRFR